MKILLFEDSSKTVNGGGQYISLLISKFLLEKNFSIFYVDFFNNINISTLLNSNGNNIFILDSLKKPLVFFYDFFKLYFKIKKYNPDLIYCTTKKALVIGFLYSKLLNIKIIYHVHLATKDSFSDFIIFYIMKRLDLCICVSEFIYNQLKIKKLSNLVLLNNPLIGSKKNKSRNINNCEVKLGFAGSLIHTKGVSFLLKSFLNLDQFKFKLNIFGDGELHNDLKKQFNINKNINFFGHVSNLSSHLDEFVDIFILPSPIPESSSLVLQQAISRSIPVITTNLGGQKYFVKNHFNGILIDVNNQESLFHAINYIVENYSSMSKNCMIFSNQFINEESYLDKFKKIIKSLNENIEVK